MTPAEIRVAIRYHGGEAQASAAKVADADPASAEDWLQAPPTRWGETP